MPEWEPNRIEPLIESLSSDDSFDRLNAIEQLEKMTHRTFGFRFNASPGERTAAIERWKGWWKEEQRDKERRSQLHTAVQLSGGMLDLDSLKKAIKEIPAEKIQGYLNALIFKMKAQEMRCESCGVRPASVSVTEIVNGSAKTRRLCDRCALDHGEVLG